MVIFVTNRMSANSGNPAILSTRNPEPKDFRFWFYPAVCPPAPDPTSAQMGLAACLSCSRFSAWILPGGFAREYGVEKLRAACGYG
jgi:hypothetical protein